MMQTALTVSTALLWVAVLALGAICLALVRQIGILYERIMPAGALMIDKGPAVGAIAPAFELTDIRGSQVKVGGIDASGKATLLFFLSPTCPVCKKLLPLLPSLQASESTPMNIVLASDGDIDEHTRFARKHDLGCFPYVLSQELGLAYQIGKLPYAVLLDETGTVRAKGLVNTREHLESLFEAKERGVASLQQFVHGDHSHDAHAQHA
ncbi:methylamine dehydrogenase accessory protein MauD [Burkholderia cepacia]|uniref:methylamine dehydrogenase accessory protein MauD n=1 Tax=Burkholderia cepacia TaxID=292 RepID=UPI001CF428CA|nr:methylamine dehydrogenase accessory protein MauD [Burkholderia cepacia]MCA7939148.1 methylamine dehydrogenase accessory protein MauD [Burkholderia cepacia]MDN7634981.1 methylamine dehydrogenase accessory protein MauD [Burkholderia cepacia]